MSKTLQLLFNISVTAICLKLYPVYPLWLKRQHFIQQPAYTIWPGIRLSRLAKKTALFKEIADSQIRKWLGCKFLHLCPCVTSGAWWPYISFSRRLAWPWSHDQRNTRFYWQRTLTFVLVSNDILTCRRGKACVKRAWILRVSVVIRYALLCNFRGLTTHPEKWFHVDI